jgi:cbb3-type cytochrome oxidase cytochrome c subunit
MPRKPPAEPIDHHYDIPKLNLVFFVTGILMAAIFIGMIYADYKRDWKTIQRLFLRIDAQKTHEAAQRAREKAYGEERARLLADLRAARGEMVRHQKTLNQLNARLEDLAPRIYLADQQAKFAKASFDAALYKYEDSVANRPKAAPSAKKDLERIRGELNEANMRLAKLKQDEAAANAEIKRLTERRDETRASIEKLSADFKLTRQKYESLQQDALFQLRNSPILDMINPSLRVQQVQLPEHFNDVNFMKIPRVDRCATCHVGADRTGFEDAKNAVFRTHPQLNLMVGSESPHPYFSFGCTPCHGGRDRASSFWSAGHSPASERQEKSWEKKYDWQFDRFNEMPILPLKYTDAGCYRCHAEETNFRDAPMLDAGMKMVEGLGCWGCHRIEGLEKQGLPKVGPSLEKLGSKVSKEWAMRWVMNPASFRANTKMPTFFYLENFVNVSGPQKPTPAQERLNAQGRVENDAMVNSIVAYLFEKSQPAVVPAVPGRGDPLRGQKLLESRGCFGCHLADPNAERDLVGTYRQYGPNLAGIGSKASREWIYQWIRDPKAWNPETKMPNLRLSHEDALDLAEYLATLKARAAFEAAPLPKTDTATLEQVALYFQMATKTIFDAKAELSRMDVHAKEVYVGEKLIGYYGCFACHRIRGFEDAKPIGTELTEEGSKAVHRLDFGFVHLSHTRQDWFRAKLENTRLFDRDRARGWEEKLKMPLFRFSPWELDYVTTAVLGFQKLNASAAAKKVLDANEEAIERGRRIVKNHNCNGCHVIEGYGGSIRALFTDPTMAPPIIQGEGAKVQSDWFNAFLASPKTGQIRPWLDAHMPTFGFTPEELNDLTRYFATLDKARYPFDAADFVTDPKSWAAGKKVFELLKCMKCHPRSEQEMNAPGVDRSSLAPNLQMASTRLRHDWINDWIRRPDQWMPGTRMPTNFPLGEDGRRISPLAGMLDAPSFTKDREEFAGILGGDTQAKTFLSSPDAVTRALRDYVWSVGVNGGTAPVHPAGAAQPPPAARALKAPATEPIRASRAGP